MCPIKCGEHFSKDRRWASFWVTELASPPPALSLQPASGKDKRLPEPSSAQSPSSVTAGPSPKTKGQKTGDTPVSIVLVESVWFF